VKILAIDPGPTESAFVEIHDSVMVRKGKIPNAELIDLMRNVFLDVVVIERIASYGMAVGEEVFETVFWSGRFAQIALLDLADVHRIPRLKVKLNLCKDSKAKDSNIRQALIDRYGGPRATKKGGELHGVSKDIWAALAVGLTYLDTRGSG